MKIAFHSNQLCERGTEVALYDYAHYNEELLLNNSIILSDGKNMNNTASAIDKFKNRFDVYLYDDFSDVDSILIRNNVDVLYAIKSGEKDHVLSNKVKTAVHCVFNPTDPHGDVYASISDRLNDRFGLSVPVVPHMVYLPDFAGDLREVLGIPENAIIYGRYGGFDTFDIDFVHQTISRVVNARDDVYFLFMNTKPFYRSWLKKTHKQIIHLPSTVSVKEKVEFINTCNAMLHARSSGETFGLAIAEFSVKNKPVITWKPDHQDGNSKYYDDAHLDMLGDKVITYSDSDDLYNTLMSYDPSVVSKGCWDSYSKKYGPDVVMRLFKDIFL